MTVEYKQALTELNLILNIMGNEYICKLPSKLHTFIKENMDKSYICNINVNKPINEQLLKKDTKILLSLIYRNYWCSDEKKKELIERELYLKKEREKEIHEKYNPDNIFKNRNMEVIDEEKIVNKVEMVKYKETIFRRILNKFKKILYKTKSNQ